MTRAGGLYGGSAVDLAGIPGDDAATISFAHEYVHFLQQLGSVVGFRILGELIDLSIKGALVVAGIIPPEGGNVDTQEILPPLRAQPEAAGRSVGEISERVKTIRDEGAVLFSLDDYDYSGGKGPWDIDRRKIVEGSYADEHFGIVTPSGRFRPINVTMLAEGMARRIDRWLANGLGSSHVWPQSRSEDEVYNGIRTLLSQQRYGRSVTARTVDRLTVIVCHLALATPRPDHALHEMADHLARGSASGGLPQTVAIELRDLLKRRGLLRPAAFNEVMDEALHGASRVMPRVEFFGIYEQLRKIQNAANIALFQPHFFAQEEMTWNVVKGWMTTFSLPAVIAEDGPVTAIDGVPCRSAVSDLLQEGLRVLW